MQGQTLMKHDHALIGAPVHVFDAGWPDSTRPRAGFIDGFAADQGMFSVTVEMAFADQQGGLAPRQYKRRCLVVQDLADRPVGVDLVAVLRGGLVNTAQPVQVTEALTTQPAPSRRTLDKAAGLAVPPAGLPEYSDDDDDDETEAADEDHAPAPEPTPPEKPATKAKKATKKAPAKKSPAKPAPAPKPAPKAQAPRPTIEPRPPGFDGDGPEAPGFGAVGGPRIVSEGATAVGAESDAAPLTPGATIGDATPRSAGESRSPIDQLIGSTTWKIVADLAQSHSVGVARTGQKELSLSLPDEDKPVAKVLWISARPGHSTAAPTGGGFCLKIRDRGGRCSITLAENLRLPAELQRELSRMARAIRAAARAEAGDWGSSAANMQSELAAD